MLQRSYIRIWLVVIAQKIMTGIMSWIFERQKVIEKIMSFQGIIHLVRSQIFKILKF